MGDANITCSKSVAPLPRPFRPGFMWRSKAKTNRKVAVSKTTIRGGAEGWRHQRVTARAAYSICFRGFIVELMWSFCLVWKLEDFFRLFVSDISKHELQPTTTEGPAHRLGNNKLLWWHPWKLGGLRWNLSGAPELCLQILHHRDDAVLECSGSKLKLLELYVTLKSLVGMTKFTLVTVIWVKERGHRNRRLSQPWRLVR